MILVLKVIPLIAALAGLANSQEFNQYSAQPSSNYGADIPQQQLSNTHQTDYNVQQTTIGQTPNRGTSSFQKCQNVAEGVFKCSPENRPTYKNKYELWLQPTTVGAKPITIHVPNYKFDEWISAKFNAAKGSTSTINVVLEKPEFVYGAAAQPVPNAGSNADVQVSYEKFEPIDKHFKGSEIMVLPAETEQRPFPTPITSPSPLYPKPPMQTIPPYPPIYKREIMSFMVPPAEYRQQEYPTEGRQWYQPSQQFYYY